MRATMDEAELVIAEPTIAAALDAARARAEESGRIIVRVELDGAPLSDDDLASPPSDPMGDSSLDFQTAEPFGLVLATLEEVGASLPRLRKQLVETGARIDRSEHAGAFELLEESVGLWQNLCQAMADGAALVGVRLDDVAIEGGDTVERVVRDQIGMLGQLNETVRGQDWSGLSDLLSFDMVESSERWGRALDALRGAIEAERNARGAES